ncbi:O-antigen ligase family protein [Elusimicrobiota bacterium]
MRLGDPASTLKIFLLRIGAIVLFLKIIIDGKICIPARRFFILFILYLSAIIITALYSGHPVTAFIGIYPFFSSSVLSIVCMVMFFVYACGLDKKDIRQLFSILLIASVIVSAYGILQYWGLDFLNWKGNFYPRIWSTLGNPNFLAAYLVIILPLAVFRYLVKGKWYELAGALLVAAALVLTSSRAGAVSAFAGVGLMAILIKKDRVIKKRLFFIASVVLVAVIVFALSDINRFKGIGRRYASSFDLKEDNISSRISQWNTGIKMFKEKPFLGWGLNGFYTHFRKYMRRDFLDFTSALSVPGYPHNYILKKLIEGGLLFTFIIIWWWVAVFYFIFKHRHKNDCLAGAVLGSLTALWIQNMFSFSIAATSLIMWVLIGFSVSVSDDKKEVVFSKFKYRYTFLILAVPVIIFSFNRLYADHLFYKGNYKKAAAVAPEIFKYGMAYGKKLYVEEKYDKAEQVFLKQIEKTPFNALPYNGLGSVYLKKEEYSSAVIQFREALERDPFLQDAHLKLAEVYRRLNEYDKAVEYYQSALEIDPELINPAYNLGVIYFKQEKFKEAVRVWKMVLKNDPSHEKAVNGVEIAEKLIYIDKK